VTFNDGEFANETPELAMKIERVNATTDAAFAIRVVTGRIGLFLEIGVLDGRYQAKM
jgi:hypothetical protein